MSKRLTLNADKRSAIASVFQNFWENEDNPIMKKYYEAKENYDVIREATKGLVENIVRQHQPQEDVETIRAMNNKYGDSGGQLYHDNCFYFKHEISKICLDRCLRSFCPLSIGGNECESATDSADAVKEVLELPQKLQRHGRYHNGEL